MNKGIIVFIPILLIVPVPLVYAQSDIVNYFSDEVEPGTTWSRNVGGGCIPDSFHRDIHMWREVSGPVSSWVTPQKIDWGFVSPGDCMEADQWEFTVPENTKPGIYTFEWIEQCAPFLMPGCNIKNIEKFEVTVLGSSITPTIQKENTQVLKSTISIYHGVNYQKMKASNTYDSEDIHLWKTISGPQSNWASTKSVDFGILSPGEETGWTHWTINVPSDVPYGEYTFTWTNHCEIVSTGGPCKKTMFTMPYEMTLKPGIPKEKQGGCLIATATYGTELAPQVQLLREIRDNSLLNTESGTSFMNMFNDVYYSFSPVIADYERENPIFREMVKVAITPMITSLSILNYVDVDSEGEVLGYGISLIILNGMMYVGIPVLTMIKIRK